MNDIYSQRRWHPDFPFYATFLFSLYLLWQPTVFFLFFFFFFFFSYFPIGARSNIEFFQSFPLQPEETLVEDTLGSCSPSARKWSAGAIGFYRRWKNGKGGQRTRSEEKRKEKIDSTPTDENPAVLHFHVSFKPINS